MIEAIFTKYKVPTEYQKNQRGTLYFILRKAEIAKDLLDSEWEWLDTHQLNESIGAIKSQEQYRKAITDKVREELDSIIRNPFIASHTFFIPPLDSELAFIYYKVNNTEELSEGELRLINPSYKSHFLLTGLKSRLGVTEDFKLDSYAISILSQVESGETLSAKDIEWLHVNAITSILPLITNKFAVLFSKYQILKTPSSSLDILKLYLILKKIDETSTTLEEEQQYLAKNGFIQAHKTAQKIDFMVLKKRFNAASFESNDPAEHLYKVLKKIQSEKLLTESEVNYLKKRKLDKTLKLIYRETSDRLVDGIKKGLGLSVECVEWCNKFGFHEIPFLALKYEYQVADRKDNHGEQLNLILLKLKAEQQLTDDQVLWLEAENLLRSHTKIFIAHHRLLAFNYEQKFKLTKGFWNIVNASAHWRKADMPTAALELTNNLDQLRALKEAKLKSALFTTRGGALRDIEHLNDAESCGLEAISHYADSHNPYTLMGALCYDTGRYGLGDEWFEKAVKRGAKINDQDSEIKRILRKKKGKEKQAIIDHLLQKDPQRFYWIKQFAKDSK